MATQNNNRQSLLRTIAAQQQVIDGLNSKLSQQANQNSLRGIEIDFIARVAGISDQINAIRSTADINNPGSPFVDPASQPATENTLQARTPEAYDNAQNLGETPNSVNNVPANAVDVALNPGQSLPTSPVGQVVDVTAPTLGTETQLPLDQTRLEVDVRVGDPDNPETAFPWVISAKDARERTYASLRLARLRIAAGLARGEDLTVAAAIESDSKLSNKIINNEISVLENVSKAASRAPRSGSGNLVPRSASVDRTVPSLVGDSGISATASFNDDTADSDLFD